MVQSWSRTSRISAGSKSLNSTVWNRGISDTYRNLHPPMALQRYLAEKKSPPPQDPTVGIYLVPCGGRVVGPELSMLVLTHQRLAPAQVYLTLIQVCLTFDRVCLILVWLCLTQAWICPELTWVCPTLTRVCRTLTVGCLTFTLGCRTLARVCLT